MLAEAADTSPSYQALSDAAGLPIAISLFADLAFLRSEMLADAELAGFRVVQAEALAELEGGAARALGDIVVVDAPAADACTLAMLERLAQRIASSGASLIVSTQIGALEPVLVASRDADPVLLVEPGRAERLVAFGEAFAALAGRRVRELSDDDRLVVLRLVERVSTLAEKLDGLVGNDEPRDGASAFAFGTGTSSGSPSGGALREHHREGRSEVRRGTPGLPDPRLVRATIRKRQLRTRFFDADMFADPAWDMLLDLTAARAEGRRVSITSLCIASGVPPTTALRWIGQLTERGLLVREEDTKDRRRAYIGLSGEAVASMAHYFDAAGASDFTGI